MKIKYLENGTWHDCGTELELQSRSDFENLINRKIVIFKNNIIEETWYLGNEVHRIDGPAFIQYINKTVLNHYSWYVHYHYLERFYGYCSTKYIFKYAKDRPHLIKFIEILARHNNWLTEEQILAMYAMQICL